MAVANLHETIQASIARKAQLQLEISLLQSQKSAAMFEQGDIQTLMACEKNAVREKFKNLFDETPELQEQYLDYTEMPDFEAELDKVLAKNQDQLEELAAWETILHNQITAKSTEVEELDAYVKSYKEMLTSNIKDDYEFGLG